MGIWTLTWYELKKALGGRFFLIVLCLLLAVDFVMLCGVREWFAMRQSYEDGTAISEALSPEEKTFFGFLGTARRVTNLLREEYVVLNALTNEERAEFEKTMKEKYGETVFDEFVIPTDEMLAYPGYLGEKLSDFTAVHLYSFLRQVNQENEELFAKVIEAAKAFGREALQEGNDYEVRRNLRIIQLYSLPRGEITSEKRTWDAFLFDSPGMLFVFLMVLLSSAGIFTKENEQQTWLLLHTAKNGKGKTLTAKYLATAISAVGLTVLFQLTTLGSIYFGSGLLGTDQPLTVIEELKLCPFPMKVWQYALLALGCQVFAAVVVSLLISTVSALSKSSVISYAVGALLMGGSVLLLYYPPRSEWLAGPLALAQPLRYFESFYTVNIFGFPVLWVVVQVVLWSILTVGGIYISHKVYHRKRSAL